MTRTIRLLAIAGLAGFAVPLASPFAPHQAAAREIHTASMQSAPVIAGDLEISGAWARAMLPNQPAGAGYLTITNKGAEADRLLSASSPAAGKVELHTMQVVDDVMVMRPLEGGLEIAPGETVRLEPGGLHLMFMEIPEGFSEGETVSITLTFQKAGEVEVELPVRKAGSGGGGHAH
jgi:periplasmic copper chaperone A